MPLNLSEWNDEELLGNYQLFHGSDAMSKLIRDELKARGYNPTTEPFYQVGGRRAYAAVVYKDGKKVLG